MRYTITQAELCEAVQLYLNERVLKRPVEITKVANVVRPSLRGGYGEEKLIEIDMAAAEDDQQQVAPEARVAAEASS